MNAIRVFLVLAAAAALSQAGGAKAVVTILPDKSCKVSLVAMDGHPLKSPQQQISFAPGRHVLVFRITDARGVLPTADAPLDTTFEAHRYTFHPQLSPTGALKGGLADLDYVKNKPSKDTQDVKALVQAYQSQVSDIAARLVIEEFTKHPDRVHHLALTLSMQIDAQGRPHNIKVATKLHDKWIEETARRTLAAAKFPPIPKKVTQAFHEPVIGIDGDIDVEITKK